MHKRRFTQNQGWLFVDIEMPHKFLMHSRHVFLDLNNFFVLGGIDDTQKGVPNFYTNYCCKLSKVSQVKQDYLYVCQPKSAMQLGRGNFAACLNRGFIYCIGGNSDNTQLTSSCEKYDIADDQWYIISNLPFPLRNSSVCSVSADSIYLFGGETIAVHDYNKPIYELAQVLKSEDHFCKSAVIL